MFKKAKWMRGARIQGYPVIWLGRCRKGRSADPEADCLESESCQDLTDGEGQAGMGAQAGQTQSPTPAFQTHPTSHSPRGKRVTSAASSQSCYGLQRGPVQGGRHQIRTYDRHRYTCPTQSLSVWQRERFSTSEVLWG